MGDIVRTACALGASSRLDPSLAPLAAYYDRAEQIYSGEVLEQVFRPTTQYLAVVKECLARRVEKELTNAPPESRAAEVERRYGEALKTSARMTGQQLGLCGFPDWANNLKSDLDPDLPAIHMQGCCSDATIRASHAVWSQTVTGDAAETRVNLAFNRDSPLARVVSCLPHRGELDILVKQARRLLVRVPAWAPKEEVRAFADGQPLPLEWADSYVVFDRLAAGRQLTVTYPLRLAQVTEPIQGVQYTERWRGNTIVDISPPGKWIPMFHRPELEADKLP